MKQDEVMPETRFRFIRTLKVLYWERYENGAAEGDSIRMLEESCNYAADHTDEPLNLWDQIFKFFTGFALIKIFFKVRNVFYIGIIARQLITRHLAYIYEITTNFIICAEEAREM
jgi:hypothetical protein